MHTPGPWKIFKNGVKSDIITSSDGNIAKVFISEPEYGNGYYEKSETLMGNVHLISAAPDMYEALLAMMAARECPIVDHDFPALLHKADRLLQLALQKADDK